MNEYRSYKEIGVLLMEQNNLELLRGKQINMILEQDNIVQKHTNRVILPISYFVKDSESQGNINSGNHMAKGNAYVFGE